MMVKMIPMRFPTILLSAGSFLACALLLTACDTQGITVVAEVSETFDFEEGLSGWTGDSQVSQEGVAAVVPSTEQASSGSGSVRFLLDDPSGTGAVWMIRAFDGLATDRSYTVDLEFDLGAPDLGGTPWTILAAAVPAPDVQPESMTAVGSTQPQSGSGSFFEGRTATVVGTSDAEGQLFVVLGVRQEAGVNRVFFVDDLTVTMTRR